MEKLSHHRPERLRSAASLASGLFLIRPGSSGVKSASDLNICFFASIPLNTRRFITVLSKRSPLSVWSIKTVLCLLVCGYIRSLQGFLESKEPSAEATESVHTADLCPCHSVTQYSEWTAVFLRLSCSICKAYEPSPDTTVLAIRLMLKREQW
jgi:hypothetical protein